jgi:hypothetical protein
MYVTLRQLQAARLSDTPSPPRARRRPQSRPGPKVGVGVK